MRIAAALLTAIGAGLLVAAFAYGAHGVWFRSQADEVSGTVIDEGLTALSDGNAYCPVIQYRTRSGHVFIHHSNICSWPAAYEQGDSIKVWYDRADPEHIQLEGFIGTWFLPVLLAFLGVVLGAVGLSMFLPEYLIRRATNS